MALLIQVMTFACRLARTLYAQTLDRSKPPHTPRRTESCMYSRHVHSLGAVSDGEGYVACVADQTLLGLANELHHVSNHFRLAFWERSLP